MLVIAAAGLAVVEVKARRQSKDGEGRRGSGGVRGGGKLEDAATAGKFPEDGL